MVAVLVSSGCAAVMNPFSSDFTCPGTDKGKCVEMKVAYDESRGKKTTSQPLPESTRAQQEGGADPLPVATGEGHYTDAKFEKMAKLLKSPATPIVVPPTVMRVLIMPYQGDEEELLMPRYVYVMVDKPKWIVGDYLMKETGGGD